MALEFRTASRKLWRRSTAGLTDPSDARNQQTHESKLAPIVLITDKEKSDLLQAASEIAARAYAPYSKLNRGAALLTESGQIYAGCNVEIASYGGSLCAEMSAVSAAVASNHRKFKAIALTPPAYPCGICRQMLVEFGINIDIIIEENGKAKAIPLKDLLPHHFGPDNLA